MRIRTLGIAALLLMLAPALVAQDWDDKRKPPKPKPDCQDGTKYDDNKLETGYTSGLFDDNFVMLFEAPSYPVKIEKVCIFWRKSSFWNTAWFELRVWNADGPDGAPGTLVDTLTPLVANRIPNKGKWFTYDVAWANIIAEGPVYIGPFWDPIDALSVYLGVDKGPKTPRRRAFHGVGIFDDHAPNVELGSSISQGPEYRALGIRAKFGPP